MCPGWFESSYKDYSESETESEITQSCLTL